MPHNLLLISSDTRLITRLQSALGTECVFMTADSRGEDGQAAAKRFNPDGLMIDAGANTGARTVLESITALHQAFPVLPLIVIGDEMSAQLILSSFRAGADDFLDRESSDSELRTAVLSRLRDTSLATGHRGHATMVDILSPSPCDEDYDFALNMAAMIAEGGKDRRVLFLDFSLPESPARVALGLELNFAIPAAVREIARLDRTFLDSALAHSQTTGLYVLPLSEDNTAADDSRSQNFPILRDVLVLLQILRALFDVVVIYWGAFSRQVIASGLAGDRRHLFICCNQRFSSIRNAKKLYLDATESASSADPVIVIHQVAPGLTPQPADIVHAVGAKEYLALRYVPAAMIQAQNSGNPLGLAGPSHYADDLRTYLAAAGLLPEAMEQKGRTLLRQWMRKVGG